MRHRAVLQLGITLVLSILNHILLLLDRAINHIVFRNTLQVRRLPFLTVLAPPRRAQHAKIVNGGLNRLQNLSAVRLKSGNADNVGNITFLSLKLQLFGQLNCLVVTGTEYLIVK